MVATEPDEKRTPTSMVPLGIFIGLLAFTVALVFASIPAGTYAVYSGGLSATISSSTPVHPFFWIGPIPVVIASTVPVGTLFGGLMAVYVAMLGYSLYQEDRPWKSVTASLRGGFQALGSSPFVAIMVAIGFLTFSASLIDNVTTASGVPIGSPAGDPLELFLGFTIAPLVEEFGFRVVLIGLVALVLSLGKPWREALGALWRPSRVMEGIGVGSGTAIIIWVATGLSSITFGACHVVCGGSGWQVGKFPEAAFGGAVLGYMYVKYGFHAAVITHWGIDYFGSAFSFYGQAAYGIPWASGTTEYIGQYLVDYDLLFLFGLASFLVVLYLGLNKILRRRPVDSEPFIPPSTGGEVST